MQYSVHTSFPVCLHYQYVQHYNKGFCTKTPARRKRDVTTLLINSSHLDLILHSLRHELLINFNPEINLQYDFFFYPPPGLKLVPKPKPPF